jgi:nucleotide-binding universal stress UspA family protein
VFNRIVVGIDGREGGDDAVALARQLGGGDADLLLCEVVLTGRLPSRGTNRDYEAAALDAAGERASNMCATVDDDRARPHAVIATSVAHGLCDLAVAETAGLIVVGSCRRGPIGQLLAGNDAGQTLHQAVCPVAIAPHGYAGGARHITRIGVGFNESTESEQALTLAIALRERFDARLEVIEILPPPWPVDATHAPPTPTLHEERKQAESRLLANRGVDTSAVMVGGSATRALRELADRSQLLLIGARPRSSFGRLLFGTTSDALTHGLPCPLIAVPRVGAASAILAATAAG